ncbi:putative oxidoreductase (putative) [Lacticaseibacillus thailandensis DSM 22698 = JCM 13996]|uniref:Putative oxidoreductase (Putative) n=2 Tax=Lacticaseibacillus thailandensis TaxID=381741 RepID=A0A0R2C637_9LACO|nr:putative oxidoreductase (putative) [Lacticaseibacillus thailandensis DSM 22698 = JCM 13996]
MEAATMQKIGVIGLGNIAQKAYLPIMAGLQDQYEWHLATRNQHKGEYLAGRYGFTHLHQTLDELLAVQPVAIFVHTPTSTHVEIIEQLLNAGINVYVDKPVAEDINEVRRLYALAAAKGLLLTCGFNRRFAPAQRRLKDMPNKQLVQATKDCNFIAQDARFAIFDLMIHNVDTAAWLLDEPIMDARARVLTDDEGNLLQGYLELQTAHSQGFVSTNMDAVNSEEVTVTTPGMRARVTDLAHSELRDGNGATQMERPGWETTLRTRGFESLVQTFLDAVSNGGDNPVSPESSIQSHELCTLLVRAIDAQE